MVHWVTWSHEVIYSLSTQPAIYEKLSSMAFVGGYLTVMFSEHPHIKAVMLDHLKELMEDGEYYGWPVVRDYHAVWLQYMEQGQTAWGDEADKLNFSLHWCGIMSWHPQTPPRTPQPPHSWPVPTNFAKPPSGSRQLHLNHRHNRPSLQSSTSREGGSSSALQQALTTKPAQVLTQGTVLTIPHTLPCFMYVAIAFNPSGGTATTQRSIVNARSYKNGKGGI